MQLAQAVVHAGLADAEDAAELDNARVRFSQASLRRFTQAFGQRGKAALTLLQNIDIMKLASSGIDRFLQIRGLTVDEPVDLRAHFLDVARDLKGLHRLVRLQHGQEVDDRITFF